MSMKFLPVLDLEKTFYNTEGASIIPCDVSAYTNKGQVKEFINYIFSNGDDGVELSASCECGESKGMYLEGTNCPLCKTAIERPTATNLKYHSWVQIPEFLPPMLNPQAYRVFHHWMGKYEKVPLLETFLNVNGVLPPVIAERFKPGFWNFYNQFDDIIEFLLTEYRELKELPPSVRVVTGVKKPRARSSNDRSQYIREFIRMYRKIIFTRMYPILDQSMHVMNTQGSMTLVDGSSEHILKMIIELTNINYNYNNTQNLLVAETNSFDMYQAYVMYNNSIIEEKLAQKRGIIRHHILGARGHFTFRGVIVPITDASYGDHLHLPWGIGVHQHKLEIIGMLVQRYSYTPNEAQMLYERSKHSYNETIHEILNALIEECPFVGLPCIFN